MKEAPIQEDLGSILVKMQVSSCAAAKILFLLETGNTRQCLDLLENIRNEMLEKIHADQKLIADLDYMTMRIQKEEIVC